MIRRYVLSSIVFIFLPILLMGFQNCAPSGINSSTAADGTVHLVDGTNKQLQFVTAEVQVQDEAAAVTVDGFCNSTNDGAGLQWSLTSDSGTILLSGTSACRSGEFVLNLQGLDNVVCGVAQTLVVQTSSGATGSSNFTRRCQPVASVPVPTPVDSPVGTQCELDYTPGDGADAQCVQVCYRASILVSLQDLDVSQCSSVKASMAGL
jgi:hypothetical protein